MPFADPEKRRRMARLYTQAYRDRNREAVRAADREAKRKKRGPRWRHTRDGWRSSSRVMWQRHEDREWTEILLCDPCSYCGASAGEIDHIQPFARGGDGCWDNLTAACRSCNRTKCDSSLLVFLARRPSSSPQLELDLQEVA